MRGLFTPAVSFVSGLLFAVGLGLGGMLHPAKVIGFLDLFGDWDPSLAFVMGGGIVANLVFVRLALGRPHPLFDRRYHLPTSARVDAPLVAGSALFGVGWGLVGYCPGPGLVSATTLSSDTLLFVGAMLGSMLAFRLFKAAGSRAVSAPVVARTVPSGERQRRNRAALSDEGGVPQRPLRERA